MPTLSQTSSTELEMPLSLKVPKIDLKGWSSQAPGTKAQPQIRCQRSDARTSARQATPPETSRTDVPACAQKATSSSPPGARAPVLLTCCFRTCAPTTRSASQASPQACKLEIPKLFSQAPLGAARAHHQHEKTTVGTLRMDNGVGSFGYVSSAM